MICIGCQSDLHLETGTHRVTSKLAGSIDVPDVERFVCHQCSEVLLPASSAEWVFAYMIAVEKEAIALLPVSQFMTANEAASLLGITKQAFSKNHRIKRGLIVSHQFEGKPIYYKPSVIAFGEKNDGRIRLPIADLDYIKAKIDHLTDAQSVLKLRVGLLEQQIWFNSSDPSEDETDTGNGLLPAEVV